MIDVKNIKTREIAYNEAVDQAKRAYGIATEYDGLSQNEAIEKALVVFENAMWIPIEYAPKTPYPDGRFDNLLLRTSVYACAEGRWMEKDGVGVIKTGWHILGHTLPIFVEPTHFQYPLKRR